MSYLSLLCFIVFFLLIFTFFKKGTDIFAPGRIFMLVWSLVIGLAELKLSGYQIEWKLYSWFVLSVSIFSLLLGIFVVYVINVNKKIISVNSIRTILTNVKINNNRLYLILLFVFFSYLISYMVIYAILGFIPLLTRQPNVTRTQWSVFGFGLIIHLAPTVVYLVVLYFLSTKSQFGKKIFAALIFIITLFTFFLLVQRFSLVISIILIMIFLYYGTYKFNPKNVLIIFLLLVGFMYGISTIRVSSLFIDYLYYSAQMKFSPQLAFLTEPYMYLVMNLENFANSVYHLDKFSYGYFSFDFILALSGLKHWISEYTYFEQFPHIINADYNTYSMFFIYYRDFGLFGVLLIPFILGAVVSTLYYKMRNNPNINSISLYGMFLFVLMFSFFIPMLSWLHFVLNLSVIYLCTKLVLIEKSGKLLNDSFS